jgi:hypothetical protein
MQKKKLTNHKNLYQKIMNNKREEILLKIYDQMFNDINRHILVIWQSISVLIGAFAIFSLTEKQIISLDIASSIILLLCTWLIAHLYDSSYWYNRNLVIIANIERLFLIKEDLRNVHYYFGKHRPKNRMISHLKIQYSLAIGLGLIIFLYHISVRVLPGINSPISEFEAARSLPYIVIILSLFYLNNVKKEKDRNYAEFLSNSPGIPIDTNGIQYGSGHGFRSDEEQNDCQQSSTRLESTEDTSQTENL